MINELFSSLCKETREREREVYLMQYNVRANKTNGMWRCFVRVAFQMNAKIQQRHALEGKMMWGNLDEEHKSICQTFDVMNIFRWLYCEGFSLATLWCKYDLNWKGKDWKVFGKIGSWIYVSELSNNNKNMKRRDLVHEKRKRKTWTEYLGAKIPCFCHIFLV